VIFLPWTAGKAKGSDLSSVMADVAGEDQLDRMASATNPYARSNPYAASATFKPQRRE
jgi:hypothetical protein